MLTDYLGHKSKVSKPLYEALPSIDCEEQEQVHHKTPLRRLLVTLSILIGVFLTTSAVAFTAFFTGAIAPAGDLKCTEIRTRREWRALSNDDKQEFFRAVNCLSTIESQLVPAGTLYDDFAWLHAGIGSWCHRSSSFLPWHRYTLHLYEDRLKSRCGFKGTLPYWDWGLDWMDLANSSIWDSDTGFGGDGDIDAPITVGDGRCVTNGPFTGLRPVQYNLSRTEHCLSRGFRNGSELGRLPSSWFSPESIGKLLTLSDYQSFVHNVENSVHNIMHLSIGGDFMALTAANDPIFYVHHAQLDRLWWRWQQDDSTRRLVEYSGRHMYNSTGDASLSDMLMVGGLADDVPVSKVMNSAGGYLCYRYG